MGITHNVLNAIQFGILHFYKRERDCYLDSFIIDCLAKISIDIPKVYGNLS